MRCLLICVISTVLCLPNILFSQQILVEAQAYFDAKNYNETISVLKPFVVTTKTNFEAMELLGDAYSHLKVWDSAIVEYKNLVVIDDENANYHYKYGGALAMKALKADKMSAIPLILDAKSEFLKASELDEKHIETRWALVKLYMELPWVLGGSTSKAIQFANQLIALSEVDGYLAKGYLYNKDGDYKQAKFYYKQAVEVGQSKTCYTELANFYLKYQEKDKALTILRTGFEYLKDEELQQKIEEITQ
ncbi:hypothetical protein [uncultured Formosa sp.]|uniref:tetratricopeptide repeat protein n=1 Tax=uncultured Formosa sp. TaxID=255435 RepID=UPI0026190DEF|nr:hypothetical protein [uncultured Formosa sp.]